MKSVLRAVVVLAVLFAAAVALFHGRKSHGEDESASSLEIFYMYGQGETQQQWFASAVDRFGALHPEMRITVSYPGRELLGKMRPRLIIGNPPDLVNQSSNELRPLVVEGLLEPLETCLDEPGEDGSTPWKDAFLPGLIEAYSHDGHAYLVPQGLFAYVFYYNKAQFRELGLAPPTKWSEFLKVCQTLKDHGIEPIAADGTTRSYNDFWYPYLITRTTTLEHILDTARGKAGTSWTEPCYLKAAQLLRELRDRKFIMSGYEGSNWPSAQMQWIQGKCGMFLCGTWIPKEMKEKMPDGFEMGFFPFPSVDGCDDADWNALPMEIEAFAIPKEAQHKRAAIEFLKFISTREEAQHLVDIDIATAIRGAPMPPALEGFERTLAPPARLCREEAGLPAALPEWWRSVAMETWSQYFVGDWSPEEMCRMVDDATVRYWRLRAGEGQEAER